MKIPGVYVEIKGDATQLKKEMAQAKEYIASQAGGISDALNNALSSGKIEQGVNRLVQQFGTLNRSMKIDKASFGNVSVDLKELSSLTGLTEQQFGKLQSRMLQTQAANSQEAALRRIASACGLTEKEIRTMGAQFGLSSAQIEKVVGASGKATSSLSSMGAVAKTAMAYLTYQTVSGAVSSLIATADSYTLIENRLRLVSKESENLKGIQEELYASANRVRTTYESQADLYIRTARSMADYNITQEQAIAFSEALSRSMVISGGTTQEGASFALQFSQALQKGTMNGDEFRAMMESNGRAVKVLTDYLTSANGGIPVTAGELRKLSTDGKLTADILYNAFSHSSAKLKSEMDSMVKTVGQATTHFKNAYGSIVSGTDDATGASGGLSRSIDSLAVTVERNKEGIISLFSGVVTAAEWGVLRITNMANSVKGLAAVASGALDFSDFAMMGPVDLKQWMSDFDNGLSSVRNKLSQAKSEQSKLLAAGMFQSDDAVKAYDKQIADLEAQIAQKRSSLSSSAFASSGSLSSSMGTVGKITGTAELDEGRKKLLSYIQTREQKIEQDYREAVKFAQSSDEIAAAAKVRDTALESLAKSNASAGLKAERTALKELSAEITGYTADARAAQIAADRWHKSSLDSIDGIGRLNEELSTSAMGEYGRIAYEAARMIKDGSLQIEEYQLSLSSADKSISTTAAQYEIAVARLTEAKAKLGNNAAGSDTEDANKLRELDKEVGALSVSLKNQTQDYYNLQEAQKLAVTTQDELTAKSKANARFSALAGAYREIGTISSELYAHMKQQEQEEYDKFVELTGDKVTAQKLMKQHMEELDLGNSATSWARDVEIGLDRVAALSNHTGESIASAIGSGFSSATDALADFAATGKMNFSSFTESIIKDMARMGIQQAFTSPFAGMLSGFFSANANGNVYSAPALSAYSNSIVSAPTIFPFAKGIGLMGEAGSEAIMPLTRTSGGKLGVQADLSGLGGGGANVVVHITTAPGMQARQTQRTENGVNIIEVLVDHVEGKMATNIAQGSGALTRALQSTYGLNRAHGSY